MVDLPNGHFSSNYRKKKQYKNSKKTLKKHALISFRLRKSEDSGYVVATHYKSARNLPTSIMEHTKNPWLCISHPAPAAWAFSSAYQGLARRKMRELIPKWMMSTNSNRFHSISKQSPFNQSTGFVWKIRHAKASQQVRTLQIFL